MEQELERRCVKITEACHADFRSKTDAALVRFKQGRETLERQVRDLETELRGAHEVRRGAERAWPMLTPPSPRSGETHRGSSRRTR
jgi:hypothetical protein